jgi:hypothetical protein
LTSFPRRLTRPASAPFQARATAPIRPVIRARWRRHQHLSPVSCCLSATGICFSGPPAPAGALRLPHGRPTGHRPDPIGVATFRMDENQPGWVPSKPRGRWCAPGQLGISGQHPPPSSGRSLFSHLTHPPVRVLMTRHHQGFTFVHPSGLPQPVTPGRNGGPRALPRASHPAVTRSARRGGDGPRALNRVYVVDISRPPQTLPTHPMRPRVALPNRAVFDQAAPLSGAGPGVSAAAQPPKARAAHAGPHPPDSPRSAQTRCTLLAALSPDVRAGRRRAGGQVFA